MSTTIVAIALSGKQLLCTVAAAGGVTSKRDHCRGGRSSEGYAGHFAEFC